MAPVGLEVIEAGVDFSVDLNAVDPDGTTVTYELLDGPGAPGFGPDTQIPGLNLSPSGTLSMSAADSLALDLGTYVYKVRATDAFADQYAAS